MNKYLHTENNSVSKDNEYRNVLRELGIEKSKEEPITKEEFCYIFIYAQEALSMGS